MAVVVRGLHNIDGTYGTGTDRSQTLVYRSFSDSPPEVDTDYVVSAAVAAASGFDVGDPYPFDALSFCKKFRSRCIRRQDKYSAVWEWETTIEFSASSEQNKDTPSNPSQSQAGPTKETDPQKRAPKITISSRVFDVPATTGDNVGIGTGAGNIGEQVTNSARDPVVRTKKTGTVVVRWERVVRSWNWQNNQVYPAGFLFSRNATAWKPGGPYSSLIGTATVPAGKARMEVITSDVLFENGGCVNVSVEIHIDPNSFKDIFLDQGYFYLTAPGVYTPGGGLPPSAARSRFQVNGGFASQPQNLNGFGRPLDPALAPVNREYQYYGLADWNSPPWGPEASAGQFFALPT